MTIDELIKRLNKNERIKAESDAGEIVIYNDSGNVLLAIPFEATNFLEIVFNDQLPSDSMGNASREYVTAQIEEFLQTPIDKRQSEKEYLLKTGPDDYLMAIKSNKGGYLFVTTRNSSVVVGEAQLQQMKEDFPDLALMFDRIAERV